MELVACEIFLRQFEFYSIRLRSFRVFEHTKDQNLFQMLQFLSSYGFPLFWAEYRARRVNL